MTMPRDKDSVRNCIPSSLRTCLRLLLRQSERRKVIREIGIRRKQNALISSHYNAQGSRLIVYMVCGAEWTTGKERMGGGLLSIATMYEETRKMHELHKAQVIMATLNSNHLILRHIQFENDITVFRFSQVFTYFKNLSDVIIHVP